MRSPSGTTSLPMPSPGITAILNFRVLFRVATVSLPSNFELYLPRPNSPRAMICAWISAAPSKMFRMRASHSTREIGNSIA